MFFGLATMGYNYYFDVLERFVAMAPCIYKTYEVTYEDTVTTFQDHLSTAPYFSVGTETGRTEADSYINQLYWA